MWDKIKEIVGPAAPLIGGLLGGPAGAAAGKLVGSALGVDPSKPEQILKTLQSDPAALNKLRQMEMEHERELRAMTLEAEAAQLAEINKTIRAEASAQDSYVRRWRPTWGYVTAAAWAVQTIAIFILVIGAVISTVDGNAAATTALLNGASQLLSALTVQWSVALAVLGVNVVKRSHDKQVGAGQQPAAMNGILGMFNKKEN